MMRKNDKAKPKTRETKQKLSTREIDEALEESKMLREFSNFNKVKLTEKQIELYKGMENAVISTVTGPPGTSKSFTTLYQAVKQLNKGTVRRIILVKPLETSGEEVGILPGDIREKTAPFMNSFIDNLKEMMDGQTLKMLLDTGIIEFVPVAFMRGRTFKDTFIVADECVPGDTKICTGFMKNHQKATYIKIKDIIDLHDKGKELPLIWSYNINKGIIEQNKILNVFKNGIKQLLEINTIDNGSYKCTENHPIAILRDDYGIGYIPAKDLKSGDKLIKMKRDCDSNNARIVKDGLDILLGFILGDGSLSKNKQKSNSYRLAKNHGLKQLEYFNFCKELLDASNRNVKSGYTNKEILGLCTKSLILPKNFIDSCYAENKKKLNENIEKYFTNKTLALWLMDDGNRTKNSFRLCTHSFDLNSVMILSNILLKKFGIENIVSTQKNRNGLTNDYHVIHINKKEARLKLYDAVKGLIPDSMSYKIADDYYTEFNILNYNLTYYNGITAVDFKNKIELPEEEVYNIEVEGNNNYFINKLLTHNCQNLDLKQLMTLVTRLGENSKMVIIGDSNQNDISIKYVALDYFINKILGEDDFMFHFKFTRDDIVRHPLLIKIVDNYEKAKLEGTIPETKRKN